jgi:tetratricopeptide (TPR) repeat protein
VDRGNPPLPFRRRPAARREEFLRFVRQLATERATAPATVDRVFRSTPVERWPELGEHPDLCSYGAVEHLSKVFTETLPRDPQRSFVLAQVAISAVENLPPGLYPALAIAQLRAAAWKDLGTVHRILGRIPDSLDALGTAEEALGSFSGLAHDLAIIRFSLAITYQEVERFEESRTLLIECKEVFRGHGDEHRYALCAFAEGVLLQRLQHFREAREIFLLLLASPESISKESRAAIHRTVGLCSIELGDYHEAEIHLRRSIKLNESLGQRIESLKGRTALGRLFSRRGDAARAIAYLQPVRRELLKDRLIEEAGICGLEIVQGLLLNNEPKQAETLARTIALELTTAGLSKHAIVALGYLTEAITDRPARTHHA